MNTTIRDIFRVLSSEVKVSVHFDDENIFYENIYEIPKQYLNYPLCLIDKDTNGLILFTKAGYKYHTN